MIFFKRSLAHRVIMEKTIFKKICLQHLKNMIGRFLYSILFELFELCDLHKNNSFNEAHLLRLIGCFSLCLKV